MRAPTVVHRHALLNLQHHDQGNSGNALRQTGRTELFGKESVFQLLARQGA